MLVYDYDKFYDMEQTTIVSLPDFSREIGLCLAGIEDIRHQWISVVQELNAAQIAQKIHQDVQPIGTIIIHIAEAEYWWINCVVAGNDFAQNIKDLMHHDLWFKDFAEYNLDVKYCIDVVNTIHEMTKKTLLQFSDENLVRVFERPDNRKQYSLRWILHNLYEHEATHKGQIMMIKRLILSAD
jgi:uncharacterized damage-inducible protein DinB